MKTKFDQKNFNLILKVTRIFTKVIQVFLLIVIGVLFVLSIGVLIIPSDLYNLDLAMIDSFKVNIAMLDMTLPIEPMSGVINIRYLIILASMTMVIHFGVFYYIFKKVEAFLNHVKNAQPFADENIHLMYHIGKVLVVMSVLLPLTTLPLAWSVAHALPLDINVDMEIQFEMMVIGFIVLLLASIFNYGAYLQDEYDMTV